MSDQRSPGERTKGLGGRTVEQAVILAAGRGSRMGVLTETLPKPLLEVAGRPILFHQLDALSALGLRRVAVVVGYLGESIVDAVNGARSERWPDLSIDFPPQERSLGTAHALAAAAPALETAPILLLLGDLVVSEAVLGSLLEAWGTGVESVLGVDRQTDPSLGAAVDVDAQGRVRGIVEKPPPGSCPGAWNNTGLYVLPARAIGLARAVPASPRGEHELPDVVLALLAEGAEVRAVEIHETLRHLGSIDDLLEEG